MIGRRSHIQSAFAIKELRELSKIPYINLMIDKSEKKIGNEIPNNLIELSQNRPLKRKIDLINCLPNTKCEVNKNLILRFLLNPCAINTKISDERVCYSVSFEKMTLQGEVGSQKAVGLRSYETIPCQLVIVSTGYSVIPLAGEKVDLSTQGVKNSCGRIPNQFGIHDSYI
jgi:adrenodoxin-NADP+ reductase